MSLHDELLAVRCQLGERDALDELVARWHEPLWRYARRLTRSDEEAADVVQDVWLRVLRGLPRLREPARLRAWMFGIARRVLMDRFRERYAVPAASEQSLDDLPADPDVSRLRDDLTLLAAEVDALPLREREVIVLFYLDELKLTEIADVLDLPVGTVKSRLFRGRQWLRERLNAAEGTLR